MRMHFADWPAPMIWQRKIDGLLSASIRNGYGSSRDLIVFPQFGNSYTQLKTMCTQPMSGHGTFTVIRSTGGAAFTQTSHV
jgi:hypothetical protein